MKLSWNIDAPPRRVCIITSACPALVIPTVIASSPIYESIYGACLLAERPWRP